MSGEKKSNGVKKNTGTASQTKSKVHKTNTVKARNKSTASASRHGSASTRGVPTQNKTRKVSPKKQSKQNAHKTPIRAVSQDRKKSPDTPKKQTVISSDQISKSSSEKPEKFGGKRKTVVIIAVVAAVLVIIGLVVWLSVWLTRKEQKPAGLQEIGAETTDTVLNPDIGFYRPTFVKLSGSGAESKPSLYNDFSLYHLRVDISSFSGAVNGSRDIPITAAALDGLNGVIDFYEQRGKSVIVRFCYDPRYGGAANKEPTLDFILDHIRSLCGVLKMHTNALTAVEAGMVGPWGEMHTSKAANPETINAIIHEFLSCLSDTPILVRTPKMIYDYLGIKRNDIAEYVIKKESDAYRLGLFNDGYLGSDSDLGTYTDRPSETAWLSSQTAHLPYGGEVTVPGSSLHDIDKCIPEMFQMHLSYLNYEWNNQVVQDKWINSKYSAACGGDSLYYGKSAFTYIANHLGYRIVVKSSIFTVKDGMLNIELKTQNVGFGNLNRKYRANILFVAENGNISRHSAGEYVGGDMNVSVYLPSADGVYNVYVAFDLGEGSEYSLAFANEKMYDKDIKANLIGKIDVKGD